MVVKTTKGPSQLKEQGDIADSDIESHHEVQIRYSVKEPSFADTEVNAVSANSLKSYRTYFRLSPRLELLFPDTRAAWNPPSGYVAIYGFMLSCGIGLPLPDFIARYLSSVKCAPMQLTPNSYRNLLGLYCLWRDQNFGAPSVNEIKHCFILRRTVNEPGSYYLASPHPSKWMPIGEDRKRVNGTLDLPSKEEEKKKNGIIWGMPSPNKYWKGSWFFVGGEWGRNPSSGSSGEEFSVPCHFCDAITYKDPPKLTPDELNRISQAVQTKMPVRNYKTLVTEEKLISYGLIPELLSNRKHLTESDPICGKATRALKTVQLTNCDDEEENEKQGNARPDDPDLTENSDSYVPASGFAAAGSSTGPAAGLSPQKSKYSGPPVKRKGNHLSHPRFPKAPRKLNIPSSMRENDNKRTSDNPPSVRVNASSIEARETAYSDHPENFQIPKVVCPSSVFSGPFEGQGSRQSLPTGRDILLDSDPLDPSCALKLALAGDLTFGPPEDYKAFEVTDIFEHGRQGLHFLSMLLRKCDSVVKERDGLTAEVVRLAEEKQKLLADNAKLLTENSKLLTRISGLTSKETALVEETRRRERAEQRVAELEKEKGVLEIRLGEFKSDFELARVEIGIRAVDLFKHSPAFDAYTHREFVKGVDACKDLVRALDYPTAAEKIEESMKENLEKTKEDLKAQVRRWETDRKNKHLPQLDMHIDLDARSNCTFGTLKPGNMWLDPLIDCGPDPESEEDESEDGETEGEEDGDQDEGGKD